MDDNYFDKKLKDILESGPDIHPDESAMMDMRQQLRSIEKPKRKRRFLPILLSLLLLPILFGGGYLFQKIKTLNEKVILLSEEISKTHYIDTIIQKEIIYQIDTVFNTVYYEKIIREESSDRPRNEYNSSLVYRSGIGQPGRYTPFVFNTRVNDDWSIGKRRIPLFAQNPSFSLFNENSYYDKEDLSLKKPKDIFEALDPISTRFFDIAYEVEFDMDKTVDLSDPSYKKKKTKTAYYFVPIDFSVGLNYNPSVLTFNDFGAQGKTYGANGEIHFAGDRSLTIGAEYLRTSFEIKEDSPELIALFPIVNPTDPMDVLHEVKGTFHYLQIPITLKQKFRTDKKLQTNISAGFVAYQPLKYDLKYEYINSSGEYKLPLTLKNGEFSVDNLRLGIGADYSLSDKISANADLLYQHGFSLNANEYYKLRYWAFNLGLKYRLKS